MWQRVALRDARLALLRVRALDPPLADRLVVRFVPRPSMLDLAASRRPSLTQLSYGRIVQYCVR
jgi:hypothetical protein